MTPDIRPPGAIDAPWLEATLAAGGVEARIADFTARKVGTGQIGDCVRFSLSYASAPPHAPRTLVGKFPSSGEESRAAGVSLGNYHREVKFYQLLQARARIATPRCWFADVDEATHEFVLMMSDLAPAVQGDQLAGVDAPTTALTLVEAAKLHAAFWADDGLDAYAWVGGTTRAPNPITPDLLAALWLGFEGRYGNRVSPRARRIGAALAAGLDRYDALRAGPRTLIHCDFRPDNMLFDDLAAPTKVTVVDWQSFAYGPAASDVGYFIAGALAPDQRRAREDALIDGYLAELARQGVAAYDRPTFIRHYVAGAYQHFLTAYFAAMVVTQTPRGDDMFFQMLNGAVELIYDHDAQDWLE